MVVPGVLSEKERGVWGPPPHVVGPCEQAIMIRCNVVRYQNRVIRLRNLEIPSTSRRLEHYSLAFIRFDLP
jgi:hypothetical protein